MTAKQRWTCDECAPPRGDGWHYREDPETLELIAEPCPSKAQAKEAVRTQEIAKLANENAWEAARRVLRDAADTRPLFSANDLHAELEQIPSTLHGSAFTWAAQQGLIEATGVMVKHRDPAVRHKIAQWRSLRYGRAAS